MFNYCTLFDSLYLSRGLAMYESLYKHSGNFHLYIFPFDKMADDILRNLDLDKVTVISSEDFETEELIETKKDRSKAEYCWTCTPSVIAYVFERYNVTNCTYLDSDLYFYSDPSILIKELEYNNKNILITEHRFSLLWRYREEKRAGRFCVQFMTFTNDIDSLNVLDNWRKQCIAWCYSRYEDGKFGDQKYLDDWPENYKNVHILLNPGGGVAPWNLQQYFFSQVADELRAKIKKTGIEIKIVFFHFQYVKILENGTFDIGWYIIPNVIKKLIYLPYIRQLLEIEHKLQIFNIDFQKDYTSYRIKGLKDLIKLMLKKLGGYNIVKANS